MPFHEILKQTLSALWETKLRSFLTMFGIVWGITSVILLVGLGIGFNVDQKEHLRSIGTDIAIFFGGKTGAQAGGYAAGRDIRLTVDDAIAIQQQASLVKTVSPELRRTVSEVSQWNSASRAVRGVWPQYQRFRSLKVEQGRLMSEQDEAEGARVIILGAEANRQLFPGKEVIGQPLMVNGYQYTVIGVLEKKKQNGSYGSGPDNTQLFTTYSAMARDFPPPEGPGVMRGYVNNIVIEPVSPDLHEKAVIQVKRIIAERHHYDPNDPDAMTALQKAATAAVQAVGHVALDKSFLKSVDMITTALGEKDPAKSLIGFERVIIENVGKLLPFSGLARSISHGTDDSARATGTGSLFDGVVASIPYLSQDLPPRRDLLGRPMPPQSAWNPFNGTTGNSDHMDQELSGVAVNINAPSRQINGYVLNAKQYDDVLQRATQTPMFGGKNLADHMADVTSSDAWQANKSAPDGGQLRNGILAQKTIDAAYQYGRQSYMRDNPQFAQAKQAEQLAKIKASQPQSSTLQFNQPQIGQ